MGRALYSATLLPRHGLFPGNEARSAPSVKRSIFLTID